MLKKVDGIPESRRQMKTELSVFCEETINEFLASGYEFALVDGWPNGLTCSKGDMTRKANALRNAAWKMSASVGVRQRQKQVFLVRGE